MATKDVVNAGDTSKRVGVEVIRARGVDGDKLIKMLIANGGANSPAPTTTLSCACM